MNGTSADSIPCLSKAMKPLLFVCALFGAKLKIFCHHQKPRSHFEFKGYYFIYLCWINGMRFMGALFHASHIFLLEEYTGVYLTNNAYQLNQSTKVGFAIITFVTFLYLASGMIFLCQFITGVEIRIEENETENDFEENNLDKKEEIEFVLKMQKKLLLSSSAVLIIEVGILSLPYISSPYYDLVSEVMNPASYAILVSFLMLIWLYNVGMLLYGHSLALILAAVVARRISNFSQKCLKLKKENELQVQSVKLLHERYQELVLQVQELNNTSRYHIVLVYYGLMNVLGGGIYMLAFTDMNKVETLIASSTGAISALCLAPLSFAALINTSATNALKDVDQIRLFPLITNEKLRVLNFLKWFGGNPIGIQILDFVLVKAVSLKFLEGCIAMLRTLIKLNKIKRETSCFTDPLKVNESSASDLY